MSAVTYVIWTTFYRLLNLSRAKSLIKTLPKFRRHSSWIACMFVQLPIAPLMYIEKLTSNELGNLMELFDAGNLTWHQQAMQKYGGGVQFDALLGVHHLSSSVLH